MTLEFHHVEQWDCPHCKTAWEQSNWEYCPSCNKNFAGAVYPTRFTPEELEAGKRIKARIQEAFGKVALESGQTLGEAEAEGTLTKDEARALRLVEQVDAWQAIPPERIKSASAALVFFDPAGWRFHIPAYMTWTLDNWRTSNSITTDSTIWSLCDYEYLNSQNRVSQLDRAQVEAIIAFLRFFVLYRPIYEGTEPHEALTDFWLKQREQA